ncbi:MAG: DUF2812 domain-containing protein [Eggerthellaceae bacterium]|nr:DUF2812 domain-containing protein [Eggerthellaceae bacterium]
METRHEFKPFTHFDVEKEEAWLRSMHQSGWSLLNVSGFCFYRFEKCAPEDFLYQLDYSRDGRKHRDVYLQMFKDCGWEHLQDYLGYSYFRKPASDVAEAEGLLRDEETKRWMINQAFEDRVSLLGPLLFIIGVALCFVAAGSMF